MEFERYWQGCTPASELLVRCKHHEFERHWQEYVFCPKPQAPWIWKAATGLTTYVRRMGSCKRHEFERHWQAWRLSFQGGQGCKHHDFERHWQETRRSHFHPSGCKYLEFGREWQGTLPPIANTANFEREWQAKWRLFSELGM